MQINMFTTTNLSDEYNISYNIFIVWDTRFYLFDFTSVAEYALCITVLNFKKQNLGTMTDNI